MQLERRVSVAVLAVVLGVAACSPSGTQVPAPGATASSSPSAAASAAASPSGSPAASSPPSVAASATLTASPAAGPAAGDPSRVVVRLDPVVGGLSAPLLVTSAGDGTGRLFVVEQGGRIRIVENGRLLPTPFLDITTRVASGGERGLLGLAFHPGYDGRTEGRFYVDYTDTNGDTVVAEYRARGCCPDEADLGTEHVLLHIHQPFANHNGGWLGFGPDGDLYVGMGDGGSGGDPQGNGQRLDTLLGKLLRIGVDGTTAGLPYAIPPDNPFVGRSNARPEIWAYGLRNPWRDSFDRATGDLWIGDVGQGRYEEIDLARAGTGAGADYGWNLMEGAHCYPSGDGCPTPGLVLPVAEYGHDGGDCAVTGGYVYRGASYPALQGVYVFADSCTGRMRGLASGGPARQTPVVLAETGRQIVSFGEDEAGELYAADLSGGQILRVVGVPR